ncbi:unnamed protein product [Gordionus sp. m RMFG-2023]
MEDIAFIVVLRSMKSAQIPFLEPPCFLRSDQKYQNQITQIPLKQGQFLACDYRCIDLLAPSEYTLSILEKKEQPKIPNSEISQEHIFIPIISIILTTFGNLILSLWNLALTFVNLLMNLM